MNLIVGLGNPGDQYKDTRHNIGFMVVDKLAKELGDHELKWQEDKTRKAFVCKVGDVVLAKPTTFMNASGEAVSALATYYKIAPAQVWVVHDDLDLPLGKLKVRNQGASAGHHGVESIIASLKTDKFVRFRLGIGRGKNVIHFVLSRFTDHEAGDMRKLVKHGTDAVRMALLDGLDKAMNRFN